jgi:hypothetical protein
MKKLAKFSYIVSVFLPRILSIFLRILNWSANDGKTLSSSERALSERVSRELPSRLRVEEEVDDLEECVGSLACVKVSSAKAEGCDWKKSDLNKSAKLQGAWEFSCYRGVSRLHCGTNCAVETSGMRNELG